MVEQAGAIHPAQARMSPPSRFGDKAFDRLTLSMAFVVVLLVILILAGNWHRVPGWRTFKIRISFSGCHVDVGPRGENMRVTFYLCTHLSLIALLIAKPSKHGAQRFISHGTSAALDPATDRLADCYAGRDSQCVFFGSRRNFRHDPIWLRDHPFPFSQPKIGWTPFFSCSIYGPWHAGWRNHCCDYDSADCHVGVVRGIAERSLFAARKPRVRAGRNSAGGNPHRGAQSRQERFVRCGDFRILPRFRRDDGGDDGDR